MKVLRRWWPVLFAFPVLAVVWAADAQVERGSVGALLPPTASSVTAPTGEPSTACRASRARMRRSLYSDMLEYKESTNFRNIMVPIAHAYTDQELWELSLYIASLPEHPDAADQSERGEEAEPDDASVDDVEEGGAE